jgi:hypothetical protein
MIPWLFLRESFDIFIEDSEIAKLTVTAQVLLIHRQKVALWFIRNLWWISILLSISGFLTLAYGIVFWIGKQRLFDQGDEIKVRKSDLELKKLKREMTSLTPVEIAMEGIREVEEQIDPQKNDLEASLSWFETGLQEYLRVEAMFFEKLIKCFGEERVLIHRKTKQEIYDAILLSGESKTKDLLFEIKRFSPSFNVDRARAVTARVSRLIQNYAVVKGQLSSSIVGVLLFIMDDNNLKDFRRDDYWWAIQNQAEIYGVQIHTLFISDKSLANMTCEKLQSLIDAI